MSSGDEPSQGRPSRPHSHSHTPGTPRKRRRIESLEPSRVRKYYLEGKYNDAYRSLFNDDVRRAAVCCEPLEGRPHYTAQYGASTWSSDEQARFFAALARLGRDNIAGIAQAVGTKTVPETHALLVLLADVSTTKGDLGLTLRDVPAAVELSEECKEELDVMADALAWYQEQWEVADEQQRYGDHWLLTPPLAAEIETAINGPSRAASSRPITPAAPDTPRSGPGIAGSCVRCQHHKIRCDRKVPCTNCAKLKKHVVCEYKPSKRSALSASLTPHAPVPDTAGEGDIHLPNNPTEPQILQAIPQASLLHPENMLFLSRDLFMNRSPDLPSPWLHWSAYASDQVPEPSIMRTAFNDFHTLTVSLTKRLMQTAIIQATSRLRSQRRRTKKGGMPLVKTRDVLSAIDILGLKRNGRSRWIGVARRCNLRVFDEQRTSRFKTKRREVSWDQTEKILSLYDVVTMQPAAGLNGAEQSPVPEDDVFKRKAARHGTPVPMQHLSLSDSDSDSDSDADVEDEDDVVESDVASSDKGPTTPVKEDSPDRDISVESEAPQPDHSQRQQTLEQFDQEASRQEEESLRKTLGLPDIDDKPPDCGDSGSEVDDERLYTHVDDWRKWTDYHATWEGNHTPVPTAKFLANQKPHAVTRFSQVEVDSDSSSNASQKLQHPKQITGEAPELMPQSSRNYAAMHGSTFDTRDYTLTDVSASDGDIDADVPAPSIENTLHTHSLDAMDWET